MPNVSNNVKRDFTYEEYNPKEIPAEPVVSELESVKLKQFNVKLEKLYETYKKKNHDYGNSFERGCDKFGIVSAVSRIDEKNDRLCTLFSNPSSAEVNESLSETLMDMANYCIMLSIYLDEHGVQDNGSSL